MSEQTRTPAQLKWDEGKRRMPVHWAAETALDRAEEVAADVRALAEKVDRHLVYLRDAIDGTEDRLASRLAAIPAPGSAEANPQFGPPLQTWNISFDVQSWEYGKPMGSAEAAPEPVCQNCGHAESNHDGGGCMLVIPFCHCTEYVPAEQAVNQEPHGAARLRDTIAKAAADSFRGPHGATFTGEADEADRKWYRIADAVIRAIGGER